MILPILKYPDKRLRTTAEPIPEITDEVKILIKSMFETMYHHNGIGLAATQVNVHNRLFVMDVGNRPFVFINPKIAKQSDEMYKFREGCLSIGVLEVTQRPKYVEIHALNEDGEACRYEFEDLEAACVLHEMEHLDGKLYFDRLSKLKQDRIKKKLKRF